MISKQYKLREEAKNFKSRCYSDNIIKEGAEKRSEIKKRI